MLNLLLAMPIVININIIIIKTKWLGYWVMISKILSLLWGFINIFYKFCIHIVIVATEWKIEIEDMILTIASNLWNI